MRVGVEQAIEEETGVAGLSAESVVAFYLMGGYLEASAEVGIRLLRSFRRLFFGGGVRLGYLRSFFTYQGESAYVQSLGINPYLAIEGFLTPEWALVSQLGYRLYLPTTTIVVEDESLVLPAKFRYNPSGVNAHVGVQLRF